MVKLLHKSQYIQDNAFPFNINRCTHDQHNVPIAHVHDFVELVYVVSGKAEHVFEGELYPIRAGHVFITVS